MWGERMLGSRCFCSYYQQEKMACCSNGMCWHTLPCDTILWKRGENCTNSQSTLYRRGDNHSGCSAVHESQNSLSFCIRKRHDSLIHPVITMNVKCEVLFAEDYHKKGTSVNSEISSQDLHSSMIKKCTESFHFHDGTWYLIFIF
jgi:hypothetical protein